MVMIRNNLDADTDDSDDKISGASRFPLTPTLDTEPPSSGAHLAPRVKAVSH